MAREARGVIVSTLRTTRIGYTSWRRPGTEGKARTRASPKKSTPSTTTAHRTLSTAWQRMSEKPLLQREALNAGCARRRTFLLTYQHYLIPRHNGEHISNKTKQISISVSKDCFATDPRRTTS